MSSELALLRCDIVAQHAVKAFHTCVNPKNVTLKLIFSSGSVVAKFTHIEYAIADRSDKLPLHLKNLGLT
jgi:hypothetical protein